MHEYKGDVEKYSYGNYVALEVVPLVGPQQTEHQCQNQFPGNRRVAMAIDGPPAGSVLMPTAGNALQAVPAASIITSNIPVARGEDVARTGSVHDLELSVESRTPTYYTEPGLPEIDNASTSVYDRHALSDLLLVEIAPGVERGSRILVQCPDGRFMETTVPTDPAVSQFYVRVQ
jgi:hypothetical protein